MGKKMISSFIVTARRNEILNKEKMKRQKEINELNDIEKKELKVKEIQSRINYYIPDLKNNTLNNSITNTKIKMLEEQKQQILKEIEEMKNAKNTKE